MMLVLKLLLVPACLVTVSLVSRRWGPQVGGALGGAPVVTGPILLFVALEQGAQFTAVAATASLAAVAAVIGFSLSYTWVALRWPWQAALAVGLAGWFVVAWLLAALGAASSVPVGLGAAIASLVLALIALHKRALGGAIPRLPPSELVV